MLETGGAERTTIDIAAALVQRGDRAIVASHGGRLVDELRAAGGEFVRLPVAFKNPAILLANAARLVKLIRRERVDIVHARSRAPAWSALLACKRTGNALVTTYHGAYAERSAMKRFYNSIMARGDMVIANSNYTANLIRARYGTPAERVTVIHRGTDLHRFDIRSVDPARRNVLRQAWGIGRGQRIVLNLARLTGWKGQTILIEAATLPPLSTLRDVTIVLAGDEQGRAKYRAELKALIGSRGLDDRVLIVGHVEDAPAALAVTDVAVIASTEPEAFGRSAVEAQAMGVPVVATALGATIETILAPPTVPDSERTGWLVPPGDPAALAAALAEALALPPDRAQSIASRARAHAENFSTAVMQAATLAVYDKVLSRHGNVTGHTSA
jgi:glycosyltransferase involved in cell wall biosynthesis